MLSMKCKYYKMYVMKCVKECWWVKECWLMLSTWFNWWPYYVKKCVMKFVENGLKLLYILKKLMFCFFQASVFFFTVCACKCGLLELARFMYGVASHVRSVGCLFLLLTRFLSSLWRSDFAALLCYQLLRLWRSMKKIVFNEMWML